MAEDTAAALILKILSGPHLGAEAKLAPGEITLGSGDNCDIVLNDQTVAPQHARLSVTDTGLKLTPLDGEVMVDGKAIDSEVDLAPFLAVSLGTTNLAVGPENQTWPKIALPAGPYALQKNSGSAEATAPEQAGRRAQPEDRDDTRSSGADPQSWAAAGLRGMLPRRWRSIAAAILLLLVIGPLLWWVQTRSYAPDKPLIATNEEADVKSILAQLGLDQRLNVSFQNGKVVVNGYVDTADQLRNLNDTLNKSGEPVTVSVWAMTPLVQAVQDALEAQNHDIVVTAVSDGNLRLTGIVKDRASLENHIEIIRTDVRGIRQIENRTIAHDEILRDLESMLSQEGLANRLQLSINDKTVTVTGNLTPAEQASWKTVEKQFVEHYGNVITFDIQIAAQNSATPSPPRLDVSGVSLRPDEYFVTEDGSRYKVGQVLSDGSKVIEIDESAIVLEKDGQKSAYDYRDSVKWIVENNNGG